MENIIQTKNRNEKMNEKNGKYDTSTAMLRPSAFNLHMNGCCDL